MDFDRNGAVAFTGHRTYEGEAGTTLPNTVRSLYAEGVRTFLSGMAVGFDLAAAECVLALRSELPELRLVCVVPFAGQERRFTASDRDRYRVVLEQADEIVYVCEQYSAECYHRRNDWLVSHASVFVAWYDGSAGGTRYTVLKARKEGLRIIHLKEGADLELF